MPAEVKESVERWRDAIAARDKQILIAAAQNEQLRMSLSLLEGASREVQEALAAKGEELQFSNTKITEREDQIKVLRKVESASFGKEKAIQASTAQNDSLLVLLEAFELKSDNLASTVEKLNAELADEKALRKSMSQKAAETEASLRRSLIEIQEKHSQASKHLNQLKAARGDDAVKALQAEQSAKLVVDMTNQELVDRRDKQ